MKWFSGLLRQAAAEPKPSESELGQPDPEEEVILLTGVGPTAGELIEALARAEESVGRAAVGKDVSESPRIRPQSLSRAA